MNIVGVNFKTGTVVESKVGYSKVMFPDLDNMVSAWLPINYAFTLGKRVSYALPKDMLVNCIMDENLESGCIIGAIYSDADAPPTEDTAVYVMDMGDGSSLTFDGSGNPTLKGKTVTIDAPQTNCMGALTVAGLLTYHGGMAGSGGSGAAATINGNVQVNGSVMDTSGNSNHHSHD